MQTTDKTDKTDSEGSEHVSSGAEESEDREESEQGEMSEGDDGEEEAVEIPQLAATFHQNTTISTGNNYASMHRDQEIASRNVDSYRSRMSHLVDKNSVAKYDGQLKSNDRRKVTAEAKMMSLRTAIKAIDQKYEHEHTLKMPSKVLPLVVHESKSFLT